MGWANSVVMVFMFLPGFVMLMFLDDADHIAGAGMGFMFGNVAGLSLIMGFGTGLTPLAAQAHGAGNFRRVGDLLQRQLLLHVGVICVPVAVIWWNTEAILVGFGQPAGVSKLAGQFVRWRIAALPAYAVFRDVEIILQCTQAPIMPRVGVCVRVKPTSTTSEYSNGVAVCLGLRLGVGGESGDRGRGRRRGREGLDPAAKTKHEHTHTHTHTHTTASTRKLWR
jgi:hypothetical protein